MHFRNIWKVTGTFIWINIPRIMWRLIWEFMYVFNHRLSEMLFFILRGLFPCWTWSLRDCVESPCFNPKFIMSIFVFLLNSESIMQLYTPWHTCFCCFSIMIWGSFSHSFDIHYYYTFEKYCILSSREYFLEPLL